MPVQKRHKLVSRETHPENTVINVDWRARSAGRISPHGGAVLGGKRGAASQTAAAVKAAGATILRGGAFKPRTSPYEFQGLGKEGPAAALRWQRRKPA